MKFNPTNFYNKPLFLLAVILILGLSLRLVNLSGDAYRSDELLSLDIIEHYRDKSVAEMVAYVNFIEVHPPLYYIIGRYWTDIFSDVEYSFRFLSVIFGAAVIFLSYIIAKNLLQSAAAGLIAAFFIAILPMQLEFSQEARPYIIYSFFALVSIFSLWQYLQTRRIKYIIWYCLSSLVGIYLHYSFLFFLVAAAGYWPLHQAVFNRYFRLRELKIWLLAHAAIAFGFGFQLSPFFYKLIFLGRYTLYDMPRLINDGNFRDVSLFESVLNQLVWATAHLDVRQIELLVIILFKIIFVAAALYLIIKRSQTFIDNIKQNGRQLIFIVWFILMPVILFIISPYSEGYRRSYESHILASSIFIVILITFIIIQFKPRRQIALIALFLVSVLSITSGMLGKDSYWDADHRLKDIAAVINDNYQPGDIVINSYTYSRSDINHYLRPELSALALAPFFIYDKKFDVLASRDTLGLVENETMLRMRTMQDIPLMDQTGRKMRYIINTYQPKRIWSTFLTDDLYFQVWMMGSGWKKDLGSLSPLMPLQLYVKDIQEERE